MKKLTTAAAAGLIIGTAAVTGTTVGAGDASARIDSGRYTYTAYAYGVVPHSAPAVVRGNTLITYPAGQPRTVTSLRHTRDGGWTTQRGSQPIHLIKRGRSYRGEMKLGAVSVGHVILVPRRCPHALEGPRDLRGHGGLPRS
ncbi:MAG: hypothetical protein QM809_14610 [Gordonia sp. (in: high G+C Gram-positive bacteria)]|uniref:hypothetical protein n=1 Tax=Gordonia sp. (in: high G+C Gram-positive bacteria) TaxID=84139 RepID=UPI0039E3B2A7